MQELGFRRAQIASQKVLPKQPENVVFGYIAVKKQPKQ
ncbi:MAG: hypothetical protein RIQ54_445 [Candidatus Parcubacteria bacterium]